MKYPELPVPGRRTEGADKKRLTMDEYADFVRLGLRTVPDLEKALRSRQDGPRVPFVAVSESANRLSTRNAEWQKDGERRQDGTGACE